MAVHFLLGPSGSGKSTYLYRTVLSAAAASPEQTFIFLVPEQFTMSAQMELVMRSPAHAIMNIEVLSFRRFAYRIFDELGVSDFSVLQDTGKSLLLRRTAGRCRSDLKVIGRFVEQPGCIAELKSLFSEFEQYRITPDDFDAMIGEFSSRRAFAAKGADLSLLYHEFEKDLGDTYITSEQILGLLCRVIQDSAFASGASYFFDGFTGFTPVENELLSVLMPLSRDMYFTADYDTSRPVFDFSQEPKEEDLFALSQKMLHSLFRMAQETNTTIEEPVRFPLEKNAGRFLSGGYLSHLEQHLFCTADKPYDPVLAKEAGDEIRVIEFADPRQELRFAASAIHELVRTGGPDVYYSQFAVVAPNISDYAPFAEEIFSEYDVPVFVDSDTDASYTPLPMLLYALFESCRNRMMREDVIAMMRSGLMGFTTEEIDLFDHYLYSSGARGIRRFEQTFSVCPYGFDGDSVARAEDIRKRFMTLFGPFYHAAANKDATVASVTEALRAFLDACGAEERLLLQSEEFSRQGDEISARVYGQIYQRLTELFDKMNAFIGEEKTSPQDYRDLLFSGLMEVQIGILPPSNDCVVFGDMQRTRLEHIRCLFFLGADDASLPQQSGEGGLLSESERQMLSEHSFVLAPTERERAFMEHFYLYMVLTKASDRLFITYPRMNMAGERLRPSYLIGSVLSIFAGTVKTERGGDLFDREDAFLREMVTEKSLRRSLSQNLRDLIFSDTMDSETSAQTDAMLLWCAEHNPKLLQFLSEGALYHYEPAAVSKEVLDALHGSSINGSISRMESYNSCPYSYFLRYEVGLQEKKEHALEAADLGTLYHDVLRGCFERVKANGSWETVTEGQLDTYLSESMAEAIARTEKAEFFDQTRERFFFNLAERTLRRTVWALYQQIISGRYVPVEFERNIADAYADPESRIYLPGTPLMPLRMNGRIDRLDLYQDPEEPNQKFLRIVDYKSSEHKVDLSRIYDGVTMQLFIYMEAACRIAAEKYPGARILPGGTLYYRIADPIIEAGGKSGLTNDEKRLFELRMQGCVTDPVQNLFAMDYRLSDGVKLTPSSSSLVLPLGVKKDGELKSNSTAFSPDSFEVLLDYSHYKMIDTASNIQKGCFPVRPYQSATADACKWCPYHSVCRYQPSVSGYCAKHPTVFEDRPQALEKMKTDLAVFYAKERKEQGLE